MMDGGDRWGDREYSSPNQGGPPLPGKSSACVVATSIKHITCTAWITSSFCAGCSRDPVEYCACSQVYVTSVSGVSVYASPVQCDHLLV